MPVFFMIYLFLLSTTVYASDPLSDKRFKHCDSDSKYFDVDYSVEYMNGNIELEVEVFKMKGSKKCEGEELFAIARVWRYEINGNELITTLEEVKVVAISENMMRAFNKNEICDRKKWKTLEIVSCEGKKVLDYEGITGERTIHQFSVNGKELLLIEEDGFKFKLLQD